MLVLTRKLNQRIQLGENITITVLRVKGNTIRLGIDAPRDVRVVRGELDPLPGDGGTSDTLFAAEVEADGQSTGKPCASSVSGASSVNTASARKTSSGNAAASLPAGRSESVRSGSPLRAFLPAAAVASAAGLTA